MLALAEYRIMFPGAPGSGLAGGPLDAWNTEHTRVSKSGLRATLITQSAFEGGSASGIKQFDQKDLLKALLLRRAELDPDFDAAVMGPPAVKPRRPISATVRLGW